MSRVAAVAGVVIFILERLYMLDKMLSPGNLIVAIALLFAFANGVRATFTYHRLQKGERDATKRTVPPQDREVSS